MDLMKWRGFSMVDNHFMVKRSIVNDLSVRSTYHRITDVSNSLLIDLMQLSLNGLNSIIGRGVVVHAGRDDMGRVRQIQDFYRSFSFCDLHVFKGGDDCKKNKPI